jgi:hypothetical protein
MTAKKIPGTLLKVGAKPKPIPADAAARIELLAGTGYSVVGIAAALNVGKDLLAQWLDDHPELAEAFARGRETERLALHSMLFKQAMEKGNSVAAMFLLKSRHGYREGAEAEQGNKVSITFQLPGAMPLADFINSTSKEIT